MKKLNRERGFEREWEEKFSKAEMTPADSVWDKIDAQLSKEEAGYFKKRAFLFELLAAASIAFALGVVGFSISYYLDNEDQQNIAQSNDPEMIDENIATVEEGTELNQVMEEPYLEPQIADASPQIDEQVGGDNSNSNNDQITILVDQKDTELTSENKYGNGEAANSSVFAREDQEFDLAAISPLGPQLVANEEVVYTIDHIYLIPIMPRGASKAQKKKFDQEFIAGLDFSTGLFDPNFQQGGSLVNRGGNSSSFASARVESINDQIVPLNATNKDFLLVRSMGQKTEADVSYSYGANMGFRLSKRILLQTGFSYRKANATTSTTGYFQDMDNNEQIPILATYYDYQSQLAGLSSIRMTEETEFNNRYEFASIPIRAGYILLDRKVNLTFLAGISSEVFLNNTIDGGQQEYKTLSISNGENSPYKNMYFNGSLGTLLGYSFAENYSVTIEPSYRFAMNSFTRDDYYLQSYPSSFMVSFGVAYNFK